MVDSGRCRGQNIRKIDLSSRNGPNVNEIPPWRWIDARTHVHDKPIPTAAPKRKRSVFESHKLLQRVRKRSNGAVALRASAVMDYESNRGVKSLPNPPIGAFCRGTKIDCPIRMHFSQERPCSRAKSAKIQIWAPTEPRYKPRQGPDSWRF